MNKSAVLKQNRTISSVLAIFLLGASVSEAQVLIKANDPSIRYDLIRPAHNFLKLIAYDSSGAITEQVMNEGYITVDSLHGQISFSRFREVQAGLFDFDTSVISSSGLPVGMHERVYPKVHELTVTFNKASVDAHAFIKDVHSDKTTTIHEGYFDDNIFEDLIGYIPFKKGIKYHLDCYRYESKGEINPFDIEYIFDDFLEQGNGNMSECAVLSYTNGYSTGYCWIDKKTHLNVKEIIQIRRNTYLIVRL